MDSNRRMRSSNVQGFVSKVLTLYEEVCNGIYNIPLLSAVTEKRVSAAEAHKNLLSSYSPKKSWKIGYFSGC